MAAINFPSSPTDGQVFTAGDHTWIFSSIGAGGPGAWKLQAQTITGPTGPTGFTGPTGATGAAGGSNVAVWQNQQTANTGGGTVTSGSFLALTINTEQYNGISGSSLSSNQITLPAGTYWYSGNAVFMGQLFSIHLKLRNTTDSADALQGFSLERGANTADNAAVNAIEGVFTIAGTKTFEVQYRVDQTRTTTGQGQPANMGVTEVYASHTFMKIA